jgi:hypothetical protein
MAKLFAVAVALLFAVTAQAQEREDKKSATQEQQGRVEQNTKDAEPQDPAAKARVRVDGAAGGTGAAATEQARKGVKTGEGPHRRYTTPSGEGERRSGQ